MKWTKKCPKCVRKKYNFSKEISAQGLISLHRVDFFSKTISTHKEILTIGMCMRDSI